MDTKVQKAVEALKASMRDGLKYTEAYGIVCGAFNLTKEQAALLTAEYTKAVS